MSDERPLPIPAGTIAEEKRIRLVSAHRYRETQPAFNQPASDTIPGEGSGDQ